MSKLKLGVLQFLFNITMVGVLVYVNENCPQCKPWPWVIYLSVYAIVIILAILEHCRRRRPPSS